MISDPVLKIGPAKIEQIIDDPEATARAVKLVYVNSSDDGIERVRAGKGFSYKFKNKRLNDKKHLERIKSLVIPPAWENVWICYLENGHLQVVGLDANKRKQYKYHPLWNELRNHTKFYRMYQFGKLLPKMRLQMEKDLALPGLPLRKVLALVVSLLERTHIRVGNYEYEKLYGSFGLTTFKDKHIEVKDSRIKFSFKGKKGIHHNLDLRSKKLSKLVQQCKDIPGKELFQYYNENGDRKPVDSGMVNDYIREISGQDFTAKDFRTWAGTLHAFLALSDMGMEEEESNIKKNIVSALDIVAEKLGNTRTVCRKYYVHPKLLTWYENKTIQGYFSGLNKIEKNDNATGLSTVEKELMKILKQ
ncbi:DNA topoisomerase IB [Lacibacter sp. H375]|uniref:DNA topoisomerase IB n=1 Tax=Lacibacter sp. H375 TaxID=3133424 RepID=UPI0030BE85AB